jgi:hypothetical protein
MTPEGKVKVKVKKVLDSLGCYHFSPQTGGYGRSGVPDIIACINGRFVGIECKSGTNQPTALQKNNIDRINACKGLGIIVNESNIEVFITRVKGLI